MTAQPLPPRALLNVQHIVSSLGAYIKIHNHINRRRANLTGSPTQDFAECTRLQEIYNHMQKSIPEQCKSKGMTPTDFIKTAHAIFSHMARREKYLHPRLMARYAELEHPLYAMSESKRQLAIKDATPIQKDLFSSITCVYTAVAALNAKALHHETFSCVWEHNPLTMTAENRPTLGIRRSDKKRIDMMQQLQVTIL